MVRTTASDPGFFERSICHDGNNLAFMYTREFAHSYPRSRPLFHARFDAGSAIFLLASTSRSRGPSTDLYVHTIVQGLIFAAVLYFTLDFVYW